MPQFDEYGANAGLIEELHEQYLRDPQAVNEDWRAFFASIAPTARTTPNRSAPALPPPAQPTGAGAARPPDAGLDTASSAAATEMLRGAAVRLVENMEASLAVPTATSVRTVPAKLLEVNRALLNDHLVRRAGRKVSFTHLIAYAIVRALDRYPELSCAFAIEDDKPAIVRHRHVNLGLAVDVRRRDGSRGLLVPNVKQADTLGFSAFRVAYDDLVARVRNGRITTDDFIDTTATITNPGMIGTVHSIPRLLPAQGFIVGVGAVGPPAEHAGLDRASLADLGVGSVVTLTNTYDHRVIGGAASGEFLGQVHDLLLGAEGFYDDVFRSEAIPVEPARWAQDRRTVGGVDAGARKAVCVHQLINMFRVRGHLVADLDPLRRSAPHTHPELDIANHGLTIWDLDREFPVESVEAFGRSPASLHDILQTLRAAYAGSTGIEFMHIQDVDQKAWIQSRVECRRGPDGSVDPARILERLQAAETLERFLHTKYVGHKRFSLEGAESLVPMLDELCSIAADAGILRVVLGMSHRGRLNVLATILGKPYGEIFRRFEGDLDPTTPHGSGDVTYHLGATGTHVSPAGNRATLTLAANPSHLEAVDPVVIGMTRAIADTLGSETNGRALPVLIHGDAAFAGQGVVAETLNLSRLPGYDVDGTVHVVVNNQLGFTTPPEAARSSMYPTDVAKMVQAPIFHVNGDDPEAATRVIRLAFAFREEFRKDVVVNLVCYRRYGHNEADEPAFTQPRMYRLIEAHPSVRALYTEQLVRRGDLSVDAGEAVLTDMRARLANAYQQVQDSAATADDPAHAAIPSVTGRGSPVTTRLDEAILRRLVHDLGSVPEGFAVHPKLERMMSQRGERFDAGDVDWSLGEALAFGSLLTDGVPVRLIGQDTRRGTFSQRHGTLVAQDTEDEYTPLANLDQRQARFELYDSSLSEYAALAFEYGYSLEATDALVCWEAQFGDFANGAQIVIDQYLVAGADKWGQTSRLTLLLPHGYEGQGPEHSSARIERYLQLCAGGNLRVAYPSTAAQYFHLLRRQALDPIRVPLACFTPKRYLRMPRSSSSVRSLTDGQFQPVIEDRPETDGEGSMPTVVLVCSGKIGHELAERRDQLGAPVTVVRVEELAPFPIDELRQALAAYPDVTVRWVQEEPVNMGAWSYVAPLIRTVTDVDVVSRPASASTATGSARTHAQEQAALLAEAIADR